MFRYIGKSIIKKLKPNLKFDNLCETCKTPKVWAINTEFLRNCIRLHPDELFLTRARALLNCWFTFGIQGGWNQFANIVPKTHKSALLYPGEVDKYFTEQLTEKRITCNDDITPFVWVPFSVVNVYKGGKYRVVFNYSWPETGVSVNSTVPDSYAHVKLPYAPQIAAFVKRVGRKGYLGKADLKSAFRQIILKANEQFRVAYKWRGHTLFEHYMPWGSRAASAQCHLLGQIIVIICDSRLPDYLKGYIINYIDDFIFGGP